MQRQTGSNYQGSNFAKALFVSEGKVGKSSFEIASALGVLPWQKYGGVVERPEDLYVITFDANALGGIQRFLMESCKAPKEALNFNVFNLQDDMRKASERDTPYDETFYNLCVSVVQKIGNEIKGGGVPMMIFSSLTGMAAGLERSIVGGPNGKAYSDPMKWKMLAHQLHTIQNFAQVDRWHCIWEAHVDKSENMQVGAGAGPAVKETIRVSGEAGRNWGYNVEQVFRLYRNYGQRFEKTNIDTVYMDTQPKMGFVANGRNFNEALAPKEYDMTHTFMKLGLKVGHWGQKADLQSVPSSK